MKTLVARTVVAITVVFGTIACETQAPSSGPAQEVGPASPVKNDNATPAMTLSEAHAIVEKANWEELKNLTDAERDHNRNIHETLHDRRVMMMTNGLPPWVKDAVVTFEGVQGEGGIAYSSSVAWGTGRYKGQVFHWFGHTNSDGWLQISMQAEISKEDINKVYGRKPDDREGGDGNPNRGVDVELVTQGTFTQIPGAKTHIGTREGINWQDGFCTKPERFVVCDTAGAMEKHLLPAVNRALPGLSFQIVGRF